ncbi:hypothetical protein HYG77_04690 [Rhodococcus sp. ZPP]|uniref:hypothetical protein n=1 Tax=Rhodococcus sp. ZPP TaxID=2749906 RepID=UPI001AD87C1E|nr:hypothetical protein [Rhodococcus sp. ZPP]QTJ64963.1 hypothetical protein HYG77_04690 [Rhodococcus sp. ZPP]
MVIIKDTLVDLVGDADWDPKAYAEIWSTDELRDSGGTTVTDKRRQIPITAEGLETPELAAGTAFIRLHLGTLRPSLGPYAITIPDTTGERRIVELRTELPPNADPPTTIDATRVNGLPAAIEEVGNSIYAPSFPAATTITYDGDNVDTVTENGITTEYTYNADGSVATDSRTVGGVTTVRTYTYDGSGNLTGIASA